LRTRKGRTESQEKAREVARPEIFRYHDYQAFLRDWLAYRKASQPGFSMRSLAKQAGLAAGYLPMVLGGSRPISGKALNKLMPFLGLSASEQSFLENLVALGTAGFHEAHLAALERMKRFQQYREHNPRETEVYQYLTHWYYVAIREMASLPGFRLDAEWIQERLAAQVALKDIKTAIEFLLHNRYLEVDASGAVHPPEKAIDCTSEVFRTALAQYHREIFELAARSIENVPRDRRYIIGHAFALNEKNYAKALAIVDEAIRKVQALGDSEKGGDAVYQLELALFPMTQRRPKS
jgi:uncharacterized protein (TIGR02147 family)